MELISVVVITFNSSKTVIETLDSIRNQTYANLELIVSDDCSTDNTVEIVRGWMRSNYKRFTNARILKAKNNHGITKNCNIAINQAHGKYIQLIAGDDILMEQAIEKKYNYAEEKSAVLVFSKIEPFGSNKYNVALREKLLERAYDVMRAGWKEQYETILVWSFVTGPTCGFYLLEYFNQVGGFDVRYPMSEDYPFIFRYIVSGNKVELLDEVLTRYRVSEISTSVKKDKPFKNSIRKFICCEIIPELIKRRNFKGIPKQIRRLFIF